MWKGVELARDQQGSGSGRAKEEGREEEGGGSEPHDVYIGGAGNLRSLVGAGDLPMGIRGGGGGGGRDKSVHLRYESLPLHLVLRAPAVGKG
eukprot:110705-Hanusia_phi.AAC.1